MLDTTLATTFTPGTNLKGEVSGANWSFLLPSLEVERTVCIGAPTSATLMTLSRISKDVVIWASSQQSKGIGKVTQRHSMEHIRVVGEDENVALSDRSVDLVLIAGHNGAQRLRRDSMLLPELRRLRKPEGLIYFEFSGLIDQMFGGNTINDFSADFGRPQVFWLTPLSNEMHTAVPAQDRHTVTYFLRHGLYSPSVNLHFFKRAERYLSKHRFFSRFMRRYGVLVGSSTAQPADAPPQYLREIAQADGVNIDAHRWGLAAKGKYSSRKVLFFLFNRTSETPEYIVKMTRDPFFNPRLENEYRALTLLRERGIGDRETLPQVAFFGHQGGLAIVGETVIDGAPFRKRTKATADCPYARSALDWLLNLGGATADTMVATPLQVAEGLDTLFKQLTRIYQIAPAHRDFLTRQIATIASSKAAFPLVFQHGDPGAWNVMVTGAGRAAFLDWEAAEPHGMPLWDLFYFIRSFGTWVSRNSGVTNSLKSFEQQFLTEAALGPLLTDSVARYCEQTGLAREMIEPLFYTCWLHRALKEATRLPLARLESGHYVNLLRLCIERRNTSALHRLFSPA